MTTTVAKTIGSTGDYSTIALWEAGSPADLTSVDQIWQGQLQNQTHTLTAAVTIGGTTVDATRYVHLTTAPGASFRDNANVQTNALRYNASNGAAIACSTGFIGNIIAVSQNYTRLSNFQMFNSGGYNVCIGDPSSNTGRIYENLIIESSGGHNNYVLQMFDSSGVLRNSCIIARTVAPVTAIINIDNGASAYNVTAVYVQGGATALRANFGSGAVFKNCAFFGCTTLQQAGGTTVTFTTCRTDVASPPSGCTTTTYNTSLFINIIGGTHDFRPPSGSALIDTGTTETTNAAVDIAGTTRPQGSAYDVGCWEYVAAAAFKPYFVGAANSAISDGARAA